MVAKYTIIFPRNNYISPNIIISFSSYFIVNSKLLVGIAGISAGISAAIKLQESNNQY